MTQSSSEAVAPPAAEPPERLSKTRPETLPKNSPMTLYVCTTCRDAQHVQGQDGPCGGARLHAALDALPRNEAIAIVPVECLSSCRRTCVVSFSAIDKWTYVFGDLSADTSAEIILHGAYLYVQAADGIIPWKLRHDALKKGAVARIPPRTFG